MSARRLWHNVESCVARRRGILEREERGSLRTETDDHIRVAWKKIAEERLPKQIRRAKQ